MGATVRPSVTSQAAPTEHQKARQGDDESRHPAIGDPEALPGTDQAAQDQPDDDGQGPVPSRSQREDFDLEKGDDHAGETEHRSHRKVDMTGDDDQHHARRHDPTTVLWTVRL